MFLQILGYSTTKQEKGCAYSAYILKYVYEVEIGRKRKRYFRIVGCIYVTWSFLLLPVPEEHLLHFSFSKRVIVRV